MALSCNPKLLIADEPTTALVTTQAQVLEQISALQAEFRMAVILVTHDLGVVAEPAGGRLSCTAEASWSRLHGGVFNRPRYPYTAGLLASIPRIVNGSPNCRDLAVCGSSAARRLSFCRSLPACTGTMPGGAASPDWPERGKRRGLPFSAVGPCVVSSP